MTPAAPLQNVNHGYVITGSSNFSHSGLEGNLEFNVLLGEPEDHDYALHRFNELWNDAVDVKEIHEVIVSTVEKHSPYAQFTPYELYLKFLAVYFGDYLTDRSALDAAHLPSGFKKLKYQEDAVFTALRILKSYGGVFLADVVGLGKTYMSALLALQVEGRSLVIAPPSLLDEDSPGSWPNVFRDFCVPGHKCISIGKLEDALDEPPGRYKYVFVDESHRFKGDTTVRYDLLTRICAGKGVILVSATPYNNTHDDIYSQLKLFQAPRNSTIPGVRNLEALFDKFTKRLERKHRLRDAAEYSKAVQDNASEMRERVLKYVMVRRTRKEIEDFYADDLKKQHVSFPKVADPMPLLYRLNETESGIFETTLEQITSATFHYARYQALLPKYYTGKPPENEVQAQINLAKFMKVLLVKRLESSFHAFRLTLQRFIHSHEIILKALDDGFVFTSKKHTYKLLEYLEVCDDDAIEKLISEEKAEKYPASDFTPQFRQDVQSDLKTLCAIREDWGAIKRDPKWLEFKAQLKRQEFRNGKLVIFSEFADTAAYLAEKIRAEVEPKTLLFTSGSSAPDRRDAVLNFDATAVKPADVYRILVATDVLAEGVNLHRSATVVNYDIPWNPSRLMQRVGRVNRVGTKFNEIATYTFFPTDEGNNEIALLESARTKIQAFIKLLGNDARLLTGDENIEQFGLFDRMSSQQWVGEEGAEIKSELRYLRQILDIKEKKPALFARILALPLRARSSRQLTTGAVAGTAAGEPGSAPAFQLPALPGLLTYFRKGRLDKFFVAGKDGGTTEPDFFQAAEILATDESEKLQPIPLEPFYALLDKNKGAFDSATSMDLSEIEAASAKTGNEGIVAKRLRAKNVKNCPDYKPQDRDFVKTVLALLDDGIIGPATVRKIKESFEKTADPVEMLMALRKLTPKEYLQPTPPGLAAAEDTSTREVILSSYLL